MGSTAPAASRRVKADGAMPPRPPTITIEVIKGNQFNKGNLFIKLNVKFPRLGELEPEVFAQLAKLLPASPAVDTTEECDEHVAKAISEEDIVRQLQAANQQVQQLEDIQMRAAIAASQEEPSQCITRNSGACMSTGGASC